MKKLKLNTGPRYMLLLLFLLILSSATRSQGKDKITLVNDHIRLTDVFSIIKKQSGYTVFYNNEILNDKETVRANFKGADLDQVMNQVLSGKELSWVKQNQFIIIKKKEPAKQDKNIAILPSGIISQQLTISGTIVDETNQTLPGVSVKVKNTATGAMSNSDGKYTITAAPNAVLVFLLSDISVRRLRLAARKQLM
ncbi:STN and carboxypeptidase regulatory-like domain-containing protein [Pedobacter antarcticus]|uniref:STN and carboxypeptidase regulatory-like domain-containing protein n=1 Tax=Pedobacter antarcticus TaxID=34086 RepID=UPI00191C1A20|nr:STN and carboxypeptidase regulatory-like domain-containing protein [Pedobacter antarcticus]